MLDVAMDLQGELVRRIAAKFQVEREQYAAIRATLSSACPTTVPPCSRTPRLTLLAPP